MLAILFSLTTLVISAWLTQRFCNPKSRLHVLDYPNERSLHSKPTPRTGGVAILAGVLTGFLLLALWSAAGDYLLWLGLSVVTISVFSYMDDRHGLAVRVRLLGHLASAGILTASGLALPVLSLPGVVLAWPVWLGVIFSLLFLIWMANLYNFMDGMDGFAGGMAVIGFGTFALLGHMAGSQLFSAVCLVVAAAAGGFLFFNFPPARIFMGDTGSSVLGLLAGAMILWAARHDVFPFWLGLLVFSPFLVDATATLMRRFFRRERIWKAHKTHYYQRLVLSGWGHRKTVLAEYVLMCACSVTAVMAGSLTTGGQILLLILWIIVYAGLMFGIDRRETNIESV